MHNYQIYELAMAAIVGPIAAGALVATIALARGWWIKAKEFKIQERRIHMEEKLRSDELGARILRSDEPGFTVSQLDTLTEEVRQLRQEVSDLKQSIGTRVVS